MTRILIDAIPIRGGGGVVHLASILPELDRLAEGMRFYVLCGWEQWKLFHGRYNRIQWIDCGEGPVNNLWARHRFYRRTIHEIVSEYEIDVYYAVGGLLPKGIDKRVATVTCPQNMLPFARDECRKYSILKRRFWRLRILRRRFLDSVRRSDVVIFLSHHGANVFEQHIPGIGQRSYLVYHGVSDAFRNVQHADVTDLVEGEYILYVSQLDHYKHQIELVQALYMLRRQRGIRLQLVLAGGADARYRKRLELEVSRLQLEDAVTWLGQVDRARLPGLIHNARFCVYSSTVEFCPNILLEMMARGTPMAISNRGPMPEIARYGAIYYDPVNPGDVAGAIAYLHDNPDEAARLGRRAEEISQGFSWATAARLTMRAIQEAESAKPSVQPVHSDGDEHHQPGDNV